MRSIHHPQAARAVVLALAALPAVGLAACGQGRSPAAPASQPEPVVTVNLGEYFYRPKLLTVRVGQPVRFVNVGKIAHTVADSSAAGAVRSELIRPRPLERGQSQTVTFARPGRITYLCTFHPALMRGVITVTP